MAGRHLWQRLLECASRDLGRVQMPEPIEIRRHDEQMHQVTMIRNEVVKATAAKPAGICQVEPESSLVYYGWGRLERLVHVSRVARCLCAPPHVAEKYGAHDDSRGNCSSDTTTPAPPRSRGLAGLQAGFARDGGHNGNEAGAEDEHEAREQY